MAKPPRSYDDFNRESQGLPSATVQLVKPEPVPATPPAHALPAEDAPRHHPAYSVRARAQLTLTCIKLDGASESIGYAYLRRKSFNGRDRLALVSDDCTIMLRGRHLYRLRDLMDEFKIPVIRQTTPGGVADREEVTVEEMRFLYASAPPGEEA